MSHQLEIQPRELKFTVELNKQSKCSIRLVNKTDNYVAFKVKTTSPKKYCVRPNVGVVLPNATYEFVDWCKCRTRVLDSVESWTRLLWEYFSCFWSNKELLSVMSDARHADLVECRIIMQAPKEVPVDLTCKDKFLILNTIVPDGTLEENITSETFPKDSERYIEERKLRVILSTPPSSNIPALSTVNGTQEQVPTIKADSHVELKSVNPEELKLVKDSEAVPIFNVKLEPIKNASLEPSKIVNSNALKDVETKFLKDVEPTNRNFVEGQEIEPRVRMGEDEQRLFKEVEEMKFKLHELESKLHKTEVTTSKLTEERRLAIRERESLQQEMAILRKRKVERRVHDGFPLLFVGMVAFISLVVGYGFHP